MIIDLDALEATARAATPGPWEFRTESPSMGGDNYTIRQAGVPGIRMSGYVYGFGTGMIEHITTFDPPTVLALIARLREARQELREAEAVIEQVRARLPGPRTFAESMSRDFAGNLWPRNVDADEIAAILATYKPTNQEEP